MTSQPLSLPAAAERTGISADVLRRAALNGLALPVTGTDDCFAEDEVAAWSDWGAIGRLLGRLRPLPRGGFAGEHIAVGAYAARNRYRLPFSGAWLVGDGGNRRTPDGYARSGHAYLAPCVQWAWDFCRIHPDDYARCHAELTMAELTRLRLRRGQAAGEADFAVSEPWERPAIFTVLREDGRDQRLHYLYETDVVAPADGRILSRMGRADDPSFAEAVAAARANGADDEASFFIEHAGGEYSQFAHVLARSLTVQPGEQVVAGEVLCQAGAAHHHLPHLHWGVWDSWHPLFAESLPITIAQCEVFEQNHFQPRQSLWLEAGLVVRAAVD